MINLKFKTRDGSNFKSKSRIYFSAHPNDFNLLDKFADAILDKYNCAIFYNDETDIDIADLKEQLKHMQLMIVPITKSFLLEKNISRDVEFNYAKENHIPLLPIMIDSGLLNIYSEVCGDTQFLDITTKDKTTISFEKKADDFLSSVLLSDEEIEKIRKEFDAYIFLSYRKKDRLHSLELMKNIHKNDDFRDIAIWYDEFLSLGEDFNDEINQALTKSDLFMLLVTPNLVNEENYVMKIEYPYARSINKPIVAIEALETDFKELQDKYEEVPTCIESLNIAAISKAIFDNIDNISLAKNDTPEHNFLIGLAYMKGVDVEVDIQKGINLITDSATKGYLNAIKESIKIYRNGIGVKQDIDKVLYWQRQLINYYIKNEERILQSYSRMDSKFLDFYDGYIFAKLTYADTYGENYDVEEADRVILECKDLLSYYDDQTRYHIANYYIEKMLIANLERTNRYKEVIQYFPSLLNSIETIYIKEQIYSQYIESKINYGICNRILGYFDQAIEIFESTLKILNNDSITEYFDVSELKDFYISIYKEIGTASILKKDGVSSILTKESFKKCLDLSKELLTISPSEKSIGIYAEIYCYIANFAVLLKKYNIAEKLYLECIHSLQNINKKSVIDESTKVINIKLNRELSKMYFLQGKLDLCRAYFKQACDYLQKDINESSDTLERSNVFLLISRMGHYIGLVDEELHYLMEVLKITPKKHALLLAKTYSYISQCYEETEEYEKSLEYSFKAMEYVEMLKNKNNNMYYQLIGEVCSCITHCYNQLGYDTIKSYNAGYKPIVDAFMQLPENSPHLYSVLVINSIYFYAESRMWDSNTFDEAEALLLFSLKCYKKISKQDIGNHFNSIASVYNSLFNFYFSKGNYDKALESLEEGLKSTSNNLDTYESRIEIFNKYIEYYSSKDNFEMVQRYFKMAQEDVRNTLKILFDKDLNQLDSINNFYYILNYSSLLNRYAVVLIHNTKYKEALSLLESASLLLMKVEIAKEHRFAYQTLANIHTNIGVCYTHLKNYEQVEKYFISAIEYHKKNSFVDNEAISKLEKAIENNKDKIVIN